MFLALLGGLLVGNGGYVLRQKEQPLYPKPIATVFVCLGIALVAIALMTPSFLF